jgi:dienelactone hydrolase
MTGRWHMRLGAASIVCAWALAHAAPPPAEAFARPPAITTVVPSPTGKRVAMIVKTEDGRDAIAVLALPVQRAAQAVGAFKNATIYRVFWVNDERLVYEVYQEALQAGYAAFGAFAVNHDGSGERELIGRYGESSIGTRLPVRVLPHDWTAYGSFHDGTRDILVYERVTQGPHAWSIGSLARLNTDTGAVKPLSIGMPSGAIDWVIDRKGELRIVRTRERDRVRLYARDGEQWALLEDLPLQSARALDPVAMEGDDTLVVRTRAGADTEGLYTYNLRERRLESEPLVRLQRYDIGSAERDEQAQRVIGAHYVADQPGSVWFSARMAGIQRAVDAALPGRSNSILCGLCESSTSYAVFSRSDRQPGEYYVYEPERRTLARIGETRPWIDTVAQGERTFHWATARDGLALPLVVTHPPGRRADELLPAVVLVHGGPWLRGADRRWSAGAQFLATRGYRVIEPDFRGSLGYGARHFEAGWKQWGQKMEDDLADAAAWAAERKLIDPARVCIVGASYGGYAALMGPIRHPSVFRCAVSAFGVTDIDLMFSSARSDFTRDHVRYTMPMLIGDPVADAEMLRQASPVERAAEIKVPVLLVVGTQDRRVPREHADRFESAARKAGVALERVDYHDEAHGFNQPRNEADYLKRLEGFLGRTLKP